MERGKVKPVFNLVLNKGKFEKGKTYEYIFRDGKYYVGSQDFTLQEFNAFFEIISAQN